MRRGILRVTGVALRSVLGVTPRSIEIVLLRVPLATLLTATTVALLALPAYGQGAPGGAAPLAARRTAGHQTGQGPTVSVRVEGLKKTRLLATSTSVRSGWITKGGTPKGQCSAQSAAGALNVATKGDWMGKWSAKYQALSVTGILGESHSFSSPYYWSVWVNDKYASSGVCGITLKKGDQLLFAVEPDSTMWYPTTLSAPHDATRNHPFTVKVMGYTSSGKKPLAGVTVSGNGITSTKTDHSGVATVTDSHSGVLILRASPMKFIRSEAIVHVAS
ncbi:MAG TPA: hypothetical protein VE983_09460 [Solirubrobacteraceae bacterium]|nr:hypothetical protein [Solirubrobacteraceae bacterium]